MLGSSVLLERDEIPILDAHPSPSSVTANVSRCMREARGGGKEEKREMEV